MDYKVDHMNFAQIPNFGRYNNSSAQYHKSWDWLMTVIAKIAKIEVDYEPLANVSLYSPFEAVYTEVVSFVTEYNEKKMVCSVTGEEMFKGYFLTGEKRYIKHEKDLVAWLRSRNVDEDNELSDEYLINESHTLGEFKEIEI